MPLPTITPRRQVEECLGSLSHCRRVCADQIDSLSQRKNSMNDLHMLAEGFVRVRDQISAIFADDTLSSLMAVETGTADARPHLQAIDAAAGAAIAEIDRMIPRYGDYLLFARRDEKGGVAIDAVEPAKTAGLVAKLRDVYDLIQG